MALTELIFGAPVEVQIGNPIPTLGIVQFDCSISERHAGDAEVTEHPVETLTGAAGVPGVISDHIRALPEELELNGLVTNTPLVLLASAFAKSPVFPFIISPLQDRVDTAYWTLRQLKNAGQLLDVVTSLRTYSNMAITTLVVTRNVDTGNVLNCTIGLREVKTATSLAIAKPIPEDVANNPAAEKAKVAKNTATQGQSGQSQSTLSSFVGSIL
jgi:hypothetical protein